MINAEFSKAVLFAPAQHNPFAGRKVCPCTDLDFLCKRLFSMFGERGEGRQKASLVLLHFWPPKKSMAARALL